MKRKLIEVALPLEAINRASSKEKSVRHGHPSTVHLWWARRPLAACRAAVFSQLVDDPSSRPEEFPTEEEQAVERRRLLTMLERLVDWENVNDTGLLEEARREIRKAFPGGIPTLVDPFAGGASIPIEAQRLGVPVIASDLNPVAVLINKALLEIPRTWFGAEPAFPGAAEAQLRWQGAQGLVVDVLEYGRWIQDRVRERLGDLFPSETEEDTVAWIWARTVSCPNPACGVSTPLVKSWYLKKARGRQVWIRPEVFGDTVQFSIETASASHPPLVDGTVNRQGATCVACEFPIPLAIIREEGRAGRLGESCMATVIRGNRQRVYHDGSSLPTAARELERPEVFGTTLPDAALGFRVQNYGITRHDQLFSARQLRVIEVFSEEIAALAAGDVPFGAERPIDYWRDLGVMLAFALDRVAMSGNSLCRWNPVGEKVQHMFGRQAVSMIWDFAEPAVFGSSTGSWTAALAMVAQGLDGLNPHSVATVEQADAARRSFEGLLVNTDPPYYDNVGYADLSDIFYVILRRSLGHVYPELLATVLTPKADELVADPFRHGGAAPAKDFFETGFNSVFAHAADGASPNAPMVLFYAFKQSDTSEDETASTGWEVLLSGLIESGWMVTATWPMRTEMGSRLRGQTSNALASSIVLACRKRMWDAPPITRRGFLTALKIELPLALKHLQQGSVAPVDMAQAAIGPGMSVFSRFARVVESDGSDMSVRTALALINQLLDEVLTEQEGDFDADTRFCVKWFSQFGWNEAASGEADVLTRATNTSVEGLVRGGVFRAVAGKARLIAPEDLTGGWDPTTDDRVSDWEVVVRLAHAVKTEGLEATAALMAAAGQRVDLDTAKELAYLLYAVCEKKGWTESAILFNGLAASWSDVSSAALSVSGRPAGTQSMFGFDSEQ